MAANRRVVYALSLDGSAYRFVGFTTIGAQARLRRHIDEVTQGSMKPVHLWMLRHNNQVVVTELKAFPDNATRSELNECRHFWAEQLAARGFHLLSDQLPVLDEAGKPKPEVPKPHPLLGRKRGPMSDDQRANISRAKKGRTRSPEAAAKTRAGIVRKYNLLGKLSDAQLEELREKHRNGASQASLTRDYGVSRRTIKLALGLISNEMHRVDNGVV